MATLSGPSLNAIAIAMRGTCTRINKIANDGGSEGGISIGTAWDISGHIPSERKEIQLNANACNTFNKNMRPNLIASSNDDNRNSDGNSTVDGPGNMSTDNKLL